VPFHALLTIDLPTYQPDACPLCANGLPVVKPGSRQVPA
jgi:orotate phosphoribosyltransferase